MLFSRTPAVRSDAEIAVMRRAGRVVALMHQAIRDAIAPGVSTYELDQIGRRVLAENGATSNFLGYGHPPFPAVICASVNAMVVHGVPRREVTLVDGDIGFAVESAATEAGLGVVEGYTGHAIGQAMHEPPNIPNQGAAGSGAKLRVGNVLAIEPMLVLGATDTEVLDDAWSVVTSDRGLAAHAEHTIAIGPAGPEILTLP
jgi:methionyl aminopeptidase